MASRQQTYRFDALVVLVVLPFIGMFILPLLAYGGRLRVRFVESSGMTVEEFSLDLIARAISVFGVWLAAAAIAAWMAARVYKRKPAVNLADPRRRIIAFLMFFVLGNGFLILHSLFKFPSSIENIIHLLSLSSGVTIVLGVALLAEHESHSRARIFWIGLLTGVQYFGMLGISLAFGKALGAAMACVLMTGALWVVPLRRAIRVLAVGILVAITCAVFLLKTPIRSIAGGGGVVERLDFAQVYGSSIGGFLTFKDHYFKQAHPGAGNFSLADALNDDAGAFLDFDQNSDLYVVPTAFLPEFVDHSLRRTVHRLNHLGILCVVVSRTPSAVPHWGLDAYAPLFLSLVPRLIYPHKPTNSLSNDFGRRYSIIRSDDRVTSINVDPVTQAWMSGGMPIVFGSGVGIGLLFGLIFGWLRRGGEQWTRLLVYAATLSSVASLESDISLAIGGLLQALVMAFGFVIMCRISGFVSATSERA